MSMAAGEYVSVSSQADTEKADIERERKELATDPVHEHAELSAIYQKRGLDANLANQVAEQLMKHDALGAHARDELGISDTLSARPVQAAFASAGTFAIGAAMPLLTAVITPEQATIPVVVITSILFLGLLGGFGAYAGGAPMVESGSASNSLGRSGDGSYGRRRRIVRSCRLNHHCKLGASPMYLLFERKPGCFNDR